MSLQVDEFITHTYDGLSHINEAFHVSHTPSANCIRPVLTVAKV